MMLPPIFVCGTGRSGTWILYRALGRHKNIHTFPKEMRFLVDPDGMIDLIDALTIRYHPVKASEALHRFERLMRVYLVTPDRTPYYGFDLPGWLGGEYYWQRLNQFCSCLVDLDFEGKALQIESDSNDEGRLVAYAKRLQALRQQVQRKPSIPESLTLPRAKMNVVRYFSERSRLVALAAAFVDDLFRKAAQANSKQTWCEKTPQHILDLNVLWELFPKSIVIHIKRDPRGVAYSLTKQKWAPSSLEGASLFLRNVYNRWNDLSRTIDLNKYRYYELKLEDLALSPESVLEELISFCGMEYEFENLPDISPAKVNYWKKIMSNQEIQSVNEILGPYIEQMGYEA